MFRSRNYLFLAPYYKGRVPTMYHHCSTKNFAASVASFTSTVDSSSVAEPEKFGRSWFEGPDLDEKEINLNAILFLCSNYN